MDITWEINVRRFGVGFGIVLLVFHLMYPDHQGTEALFGWTTSELLRTALACLLLLPWSYVVIRGLWWLLFSSLFVLITYFLWKIVSSAYVRSTVSGSLSRVVVFAVIGSFVGGLLVLQLLAIWRLRLPKGR